MSLYGVLRTGVSGMNAQSTKLGTIADNIANTGTIGYKAGSTQFSALLLDSSDNAYNPGAVSTQVRHAISKQGSLTYTTSTTDVAIQGNGFLIVSDSSGSPYLTRAGSFITDASTGNLINTGGYTLMGYALDNGNPDAVLNGVGGLSPINMTDKNLQAKPSTAGVFSVNLPAAEPVNTGDTPDDNLATSTYTVKSSIIAYDNIGNAKTLDVYLTKTDDSPINWEVAVFDQALEAPTGGFPYGAGGKLVSQTLTFDSDGKLTGTGTVDVPVPNGATLALDFSGTTQLATAYTPLNVQINGNAPSAISGIEIDKDGTVYAAFENGSRVAAYRIPFASVASPDNLKPIAGDAFAITTESGDLQIGFPAEGGRGTLISGSLEQSNVDMASELTDMIVAQRDYTANSKVVQTSSELLDVLMNLKR
ncbi:MAG TPA: flagellar hook protein FlgE [Bauldia sp.]|nr:flagellar hook protein FlgE [Bauldia sp.]